MDDKAYCRGRKSCCGTKHVSESPYKSMSESDNGHVKDSPRITIFNFWRCDNDLTGLRGLE